MASRRISKAPSKLPVAPKRTMGWYYAISVTACTSIGTLFGAYKGKNLVHVTNDTPRQAYHKQGTLAAINNIGVGVTAGLASGFVFGSIVVPFALSALLVASSTGLGAVFHIVALETLYNKVRDARGMSNKPGSFGSTPDGNESAPQPAD